MTTIEIDGAIAALNAQKSALQAELDAVRERSVTLECEKDSVRTLAIRNSDATAKTALSKLRQAIAATQIEASDLGAEIGKVDTEITELQATRAEAVRKEARAEFVALGVEVVQSSVDLGFLVHEFFENLGPHCQQLQRLNSLMARSGISGKGFSLETFRRCLDERFRTGFSQYFPRQPRIYRKGNIYETQDYYCIIENRIKNIIARHDGVVDEPITNEPKEEPQAAVNE